MKLPVFTVIYSDGVKKFVTNKQENEHIKIDYTLTGDSFKCTLTPKTPVTLERVDAEFRYVFAENEKFFSNGYQAWTTSREFSKGEKMRDIIPIAAGKLKNLAGISADNRFVKCPKKAGEFYSHCYTYMRTGDSVNLIGSLSERNGFTVIYADMNRDSLTISKDVEGVTVDKPYELFDMVFISGGYDEVFDKYFSVMGLKKPKIDHMSGYTSWYNYFQKIDESIILRDLNALDPVKESVSIFQIDDGYETFVGDWLDLNAEKFPKGMRYIAEEIHDKGYMAGIWLAPFSVQRTSRTYKEHPDWVIRNDKGFPVLGCVGWGGAYTLDIYNSEARAYIKHFFDVVLNDWNYDMVKLDFLYSQCMYPRNNKSRGTIMCEAMEFLRECCGNKLILGCGVPLGAAFGYVDACRISCDVDLKYPGKFYDTLHVNNEIPSARNALNNTVFRRHLNGRAFCSDPDVFFLRYSNLEFTQEQKLTLGTVNHLFGDVLFVSDNAEEYTTADLETVKKFFAKSNIKVLSAEYETPGLIVMKAEINGKTERLWINADNGKSNIYEKVFG